jgi:HSP20 family protein
MLGIEETIGEVERLYRAVTGQDVPRSNVPYAPIPAERDPGQYVQEQVERLTKLLGESSVQTTELPPSVPPLSVWETKEALIVTVQMPGVSKEELHVECRGRLIHISGQRRRLFSDESGRLLVAEHPLGPYHRIIPLPEGATAGDVEGQISDGLLEIRIRRKAASEESREIPVR